MKTKYIVVEDYKPNWEDEFHKIEDELLSVLAGEIIFVEHIGSTSVKGLPTKPIIDIDVIIDDNFVEVKSLLATIGYHHEGDLGIPGKEAFKYEGKSHLMSHHLYVCKKDNEELHRHIAFRNYLREHPDCRDKYGDVKKEMALKYPDDIDSYIKDKSSIIEEIYEKCRLVK